MKNTIILITLLTLLIVVGGIHFFNRGILIEKDIVYLKNGNFILADDVWGNGEIVYYTNENKADMILRSDINYIENSAYQEAISYQKAIIKYYYEKKEQLFDYLALKRQGNQTVATLIFFGLTKVLPDIILLILLVSAYKIFAVLLYNNLKRPGKNKKDEINDAEDNIEDDIKLFKINEQEFNEIEKIVYFFLKLYKKQLGAPENAPANFYLADAEQAAPHSIFELQVRQNKSWSKRRITIGPIGQNSRSKSRCFYVIYDIHMVIKIPPKPINDFGLYIKSIKKEKDIIDILAPRECIIPMISVIMQQIHSFHGEALLTAEQLEEKYIQWVRRYPGYTEYLKIGDSFAYFMNLSKYFFLGHILKNMHAVKGKVEREITGQPSVIWDLHEFEGKYGITATPVYAGIQTLYAKCEKEIKELTAGHARSSIHAYQLRKYFLLHLSGKFIPKNEEGIPSELTDDLNNLFKIIFKANIKDVEAYRKIIRKYVIEISFFQNKLQIEGIVTNMLDLLSWLREKGVAMRDLKPDNLIVAGEQAHYPLFLKSPEEFSIGLIDVETSVFFKEKNHYQIAQPQLGGTPHYATPSQLLPNDILISTFKDLSRILHLQDWFATTVIIFQVITGEQLFKKTARLFPGILKKIQAPLNAKNKSSVLVYEISQLFWSNAVAEFKEKTDKKKRMLKGINIILPEQARKMLCEEIKSARDNIEKSIKNLIASQKIFISQKIRKQLRVASPVKIRELNSKWEQGAWAKELDPDGKVKIKKLLRDLQCLKEHSKKFAQLSKSIEPYGIEIPADTLLELMFKIVYSGMFQEKWGPF
jgi:serine/threonine protein kinase